MTDTLVEETTEENTAPESTDSGEATNEDGETKAQSRDFTKTRENHDELTAFINAHPEYVAAELGDLKPGQVKAVLALRADFNKLPEQVEKRNERKKELEAEKAKFAGMSKEQVKAQKDADRAIKRAEKLRADADAAIAKAEALRAQATGSIADAVNGSAVAPEPESAPEDTTPDPVTEAEPATETPAPKRKIGRSRS